MESLDQITDAIVDSYREIGGINNIDGSNLPSKRAIASICQDLLQILFPGFHDEEPIHTRDLRRVTHFRVRSTMDRLKDEVHKSLRLNNPKCPERASQEAIAHFFAELPRVRELLCTDVQAAYEGDPAALSSDEVILAYPNIEAIAVQRLAHVLYGRNVPLVPRMMTEWAHARTGIDIHPGAQIGPHFFIDHGTGVVIGETSEIGARAKLYQGVSLIGRSTAAGQALRGKKRHPTIENNVTIYAGTTIMGGDTVVGQDSTIGANVFVTHSIPERSLVYVEEKQIKIVKKRSRTKCDAQPPV
jgi:serine O-acetyltransferase